MSQCFTLENAKRVTPLGKVCSSRNYGITEHATSCVRSVSQLWSFLRFSSSMAASLSV